MSRRRALWYAVGWTVLVVVQFLVFVHDGPLAAGDYSNPKVAGWVYSPVKLPGFVAVMLGRCGPVAHFPLGNLVRSAYSSNMVNWQAGKGWQGSVRRAAFPFPFPRDPYPAQVVKATQVNGLWFSALNSLIWVLAFAAVSDLAHKARRWVFPERVPHTSPGTERSN